MLLWLICFVCQSNETPCWINCISVTSVITLTKLAQQEVRSERLNELEHRAKRIMEMEPRKTQRALDLAAEKASSVWWLTVLPLQDLGFNLNKREFSDAVKLRYDWPVEDIPSTCACGEAFTVDHSMICKLGGFITQRHNELRDLEAEFLSMVCSDVEIEPVLQDISGDQLNRGCHWRSGCEVISTHVGSGSAIDRHSSMRGSVTRMLYRIDRFLCHPIKKCIRNRSLEVSKKMKCYKRLIYKQFVQESGLCGPQFLSYLPKRFTHHCRALYGDAILVYRFGAPTWPPEINKNMWSSFFL